MHLLRFSSLSEALLPTRVFLARGHLRKYVCKTLIKSPRSRNLHAAHEGEINIRQGPHGTWLWSLYSIAFIHCRQSIVS
jgi:hypothetical protein